MWANPRQLHSHASRFQKHSGMDMAVKEAGGHLVNIDDPAKKTELALPASDIVASIIVHEKSDGS